MKVIMFVMFVIFVVGCSQQLPDQHNYPQEDPTKTTEICKGLEKGILQFCLKEPTSEQCNNLKTNWDLNQCDKEETNP